MIDPIVEEWEGLLIVRDDLVPGGTKAAVLSGVLRSGYHYVYATPAYGFAQIALAHCGQAVGAEISLFVAKRGELHPRTAKAKAIGASTHEVAFGRLNVVQARAREFATQRGAVLLPFVLECKEMHDGICTRARRLSFTPRRVWCVAGSGVLTRGLQRAWPSAEHHAVVIGAESKTGRAAVFRAPERFEDDAEYRPPFPSCGNYDAKAWRFLVANGRPGDLFWNVAGNG